MSHLIVITIGPVQGFIAEARRTRDLWFGSHVLSELGRAIARSLSAEEGVELIFPTVESDELEPCDGMFRANGAPPVSIANKLVLTATGDDARARGLCETARAAMQERWQGLSCHARATADQHNLIADAPGIDAAWGEQISTFLEFLACWAELEEGGYTRILSEVESELAARKNLRAFTQWDQQRGAVPRSSLDGARETVLRAERSQDLPFRIRQGEQLDAVGLLKRIGGDPEQFVSLYNIAFAGWLRQAQCCEAWSEFLPWVRSLRFERVYRSDISWVETFPHDASIFQPSRWTELAELSGSPVSEFRDRIAPLFRCAGEPWPYVACIVADGDRMGRALNSLNAPSQHRQFSQHLSTFARSARERLERHGIRGMLVYAGGDDVLAFVCVDDAVRAAVALRDAFNEAMTGALPEVVDERPTLSVGVGIAHLQETMGDILALGRRAEKLAKSSHLPDESCRNALAIILDKRSGGETAWRARWDTEPERRLEEDRNLLEEGTLATRKIYQVAALRRRLPEPDVGEAASSQDLLRHEVSRILAHGGEGAGCTPEDVGLNLSAPDYVSLHQELGNWVSRMVIARSLNAQIGGE